MPSSPSVSHFIWLWCQATHVLRSRAWNSFEGWEPEGFVGNRDGEDATRERERAAALQMRVIKKKENENSHPIASSLSHSLLLSLNFPPTCVQWNTLESVQADWWLTEVSWCLWTFSSRKFRRYVATGSMAWFHCAVGHVSAGIFMERLRVFSGMSWCLRLDWDFPCVESADFLLSQEHFKSWTWENIHVTAVLGATAAKICLFCAQS